MSGAARGLFLDLDGTLADSLPTLYRVYCEFLGHFGRAGSEAEFQSLNGPPLAVVTERLGKNHGLAGTPAEWLSRYHELVANAHERTRPASGAGETLRHAKQRGWVTAVVTSAPRALTQAWLQRFDLSPLIDCIIAGDEVTRGKPDAEPYRLALKRTRCETAPSIAVEDTNQGAQAAIAAGLPTWLLRGPAAPPVSSSPRFRGVLAELRAI